MGKNEIELFLSHLAIDRVVSASTQKQALNAIIFLYKNVLDINIDEKIEPVKSKKRKKPPVVMTKQEVVRILSYLQGNNLLMAQLLYGCGLRLMECVRLRIKDIDFGIELKDGEIIEMYKDNWMKISGYQKLSEEFIERHKDKVDWIRISIFQKLSEEFIERHQDKVNWKLISGNQKLSEDFIERHQDKVDWYVISGYQKLSEDFIKRH